MPNESPEVREAINSTLRDILSTDGWGQSQWDALLKYLHKEFGIETDLLELAQRAPSLVQMFQFGALSGKGLIGKENYETINQIIHALVRIAYRAEQGDDKAVNQLKVLHKVAHPFNYELPATVIKSLADSYHISPHLARAWSVRDLMLKLSYVVEPTRTDKSVLDGAVNLSTRNVLNDSSLYEKAEKHWRRGTTLLSAGYLNLH